MTMSRLINQIRLAATHDSVNWIHANASLTRWAQRPILLRNPLPRRAMQRAGRLATDSYERRPHSTARAISVK